ncbi:MAG: cell division protein CrgA [Brachybacterium sp.]|uniref:cell division protein CrgA n=1 Tax=Brachybacterium sp. TaxID=1891286 RepID=UPI0026494028|nr:cell division protein CrgA [Brachybacterium sp.]MDN5686446.1 cell division protein CrgA [Brachybacterium sp.]
MAKSRKTSSAQAASKATAETTAAQPGTDDLDDLSPDSAAEGSTPASGKDPVARTKRAGKDPVATKGSGTDSGSGERAGDGKGSKTTASGRDATRTPGSEVTEKAKDATRAGSPKKAAAAESARTSGRRVAAEAPNPAWLAPTAVVLLIVGLVYLVAFYLSAGALPLPIGDWNLAAGFGVMLVGGGMLMFWK